MTSTKGVSPLIASVLLIAFTVSVAMIVMGWFSGFVRTTTENVSGVSQQAVGCSTAVVNLDKVYIDNTTNIARMIVRNEGGVSLTVTGMIVNTTGGSCSNTTGASISSGAIGTVVMDSCPAMNSSTFSKAIITTSCSGITDSVTSTADVTFS